MNIAECDARNKITLKNAIDWANYKQCEPLKQFDVALICECLNMNVPKCVYNFVSSDNPDSIKAVGSLKQIFKTLNTIKIKILDGGLDKCLNQ